MIINQEVLTMEPNFVVVGQDERKEREKKELGLEEADEKLIKVPTRQRNNKDSLNLVRWNYLNRGQSWWPQKLTNLKKDQNTGLCKFRIPLDILGDSLEKLGEFPFNHAHHTFHKKSLFIRGKNSNYMSSKV